MQRTQLCTFHINQYLIAIEVEKIQEVINSHQMTPVPLAPAIVSGLINLRGQIVTAIDLKRRMGLPPNQNTSQQMNIVIQHEDAFISLLVDSIGNVIEIDQTDIEQPPANLSQELSDLVKGIYKTEKDLLIVLDLPKII